MVKFFTFHYKSRRIRIDFYISHLCHCESLLTRRNLAFTSTLLPFLPLVLSSHASKPPSSSNSPKVYNNFNRCTLCRALEFLPGNKAIKPFGTHVGHRNFVWPSEERLRSNGKQISAKFEFERKGAPFPPFIKTPFSTVRSGKRAPCFHIRVWLSIQPERIRHVYLGIEFICLKFRKNRAERFIN